MADYGQGARRARFILGAVGASAVVVVAALGVLAYLLLAPGTSGAPVAKPSGTAKAGAGAAADPALPRSSMTPEKAAKVVLSVPDDPKSGVSTGFPHTTTGAVSAAVYFWEEFAFLDDSKARQQLKAIVAGDSQDYVDRRISEVRKLREAAGLPPSGGTPAGITFSTSVNAVRPRSLDKKGDVMQVWLNYDRYATKSDGGADEQPFRGEDTAMVLRWDKGAWRITDDARYRAALTYPAAYYPTSIAAWSDGWVQVRHGE
ncbi:hypothetical protein ACFRAO_42835 [Streptomyces sp. NPDC056656]|uniref:hypothetical protein n=1 Tax=Streptomyces sp. NPDC056656 TaxID=3345895 RepID=UPI0036D1BDE6